MQISLGLAAKIIIVFSFALLFVLKQKVTKSSRLDLFAKKFEFLLRKFLLFISSLRRDSGGNEGFASIIKLCPRFKHWKFLSVVC